MTSRGDALPKCGCGGVAELRRWASGNEVPDKVYLICRGCGMQTGYWPTESGAEGCWTRAMSAAPPAMARPSGAEGLRDALELPTMFHKGGIWTVADSDRWQQITGSSEVTTKVMCDHIRAALAGAAQPGTGVTVDELEEELIAEMGLARIYKQPIARRLMARFHITRRPAPQAEGRE